MTVRVEVVTPCEHDLDGVHDTAACWAHEGRHKEQPDCYCQGNNRRSLTGFPPEAIEAAAGVLHRELRDRGLEPDMFDEVYVSITRLVAVVLWGHITGDNK